MATSGRRISTIRQEAKDFYRNQENIARKWLDQYGSVTRDNIYQQNRACLSEIFNMLDIVMENCIDEFRHTHTMLAIEGGEKATAYTFQGDDGQDVRFIIPTTFALRVRALRAIGYAISDELLYDTRLLRNETTHGNQTVVLQHIELGYDETMKAMRSMGDTLILLHMLAPTLREPTYEIMRVREGDTLRNGAYIIGPLIGEGGMSRVYKASQKRTGLKLAIKEMKPGSYSEEMLRREGDMLMHLHHSQIPQVHDTFFENGTYYIVMDFVEGITLNLFLKEHELSNISRKEIAKGLLEVLNYLHGSDVNLVFSDLSPENVIIDASEKPHLIDFGTAVRLNEKQNLSVGTLGYAAPEVLSGSTLDERTDIYSFGYILRFLYTGLSPHEEKEKPTEELVSDSLVARVINKCTEINPEMRYGTVTELTEALYPEGLPKDSYVSRKAFRGVVAAAGIFICCTLIWSGISSQRAQKDMEVLEKQSQKTIQGYQETLADYEGRNFITMEEAGIDPKETIVWHDRNLEKAIREETGIAKRDICYGDLWNYERFDHLSGRAIEDLSDLSKLVNLTSLELSDNSITDLTPLEKLQGLSYLNLTNNRIEDMSPLKGLENLRVLYLDKNQLKSIYLSDGWNSLETLELGENPLGSIILGGNLDKLQRLILSKTKLQEVQIEGKLPSLTELDLQDNQLETFDMLRGIPSLEILRGSRNPIKDFKALSELKSIKELYLNKCGIDHLQWTESLRALNTLSLADNSIEDLEPILSVTSLETLTLDQNRLPENACELLSALRNLETLNLEKCALSSINGLESLKNLRVLDISGNLIEDLSPLSGLTGLIYLDAAENQIAGGLSAIAELKSLTRLELQNNRISDISALESMENLDWLDLSNNCICDYSAVQDKEIHNLWLYGHSIESEADVSGADINLSL